MQSIQFWIVLKGDQVDLHSMNNSFLNGASPMMKMGSLERGISQVSDGMTSEVMKMLAEMNKKIDSISDSGGK